jgi:broad specificity phosphatase PhoE
MKNIKIIRHAESESNAWWITLDHANINITTQGGISASHLVDNWTSWVDVIIYSKYIRTKQTAQPFIEKYPQAKVIESDLMYEFNDLDESRYHNTTTHDRRKQRDEYVIWDIYYRDWKNWESLHDIQTRILQFIKYYKWLPNNTIIISHWKFIFLLKYILENNDQLPLKNEFKQYMYDQIRWDSGIKNLHIMDLWKYL